ncbi:small multi-drug export protein [Virgibacillus sp. W0181]|uniref:small multi-drug export protein n=1 Tax=Virgibacillus sp. W0181 TaxID=3391581 RepID=UPI003F4596C0
MLLEYTLIFLGAAIPWLEVALVVPIGIVMGLSPFWVMVVAFLGNLTTVLALVFGIEKVKLWFKRRRKKETSYSKRGNRAVKSWNKYGLPGLAFLGPILIGTHIAAFIGLVLGANKKPMIIWMTISIALWVLIFGSATALGFDLFTKNL